MATTQVVYDRLKEVTEFDLSKAGVKGLVDSGIQSIPRIFLHDAENLPKPPKDRVTDLQVPVIDIGGIQNQLSRRHEIIKRIDEACKLWGFFQVVNHGIPEEVLDDVIRGVKMFHEQDKETKAELYSRDLKKNVRYECNFDLYQSRAANWRDTLVCVNDDGSLNPDEIPLVCRDVIWDYRKKVTKVAAVLLELISEALGLNRDYLKSINCAKTQYMVGHYYPPCPEPELTLGTSKHADGSFMTLLVQDDLGGLQVLHDNDWVDVAPVRSALVINIGDQLQLISNDKFKSVHHRVVASIGGPRISVAVFFQPSNDEDRAYGPIEEICSDDNPPKYQQVVFRDYLACIYSMGIGREHALQHFKKK